MMHGDFWADTVTGADGAFEVRSCPPRPLRLRFLEPGVDRDSAPALVVAGVRPAPDVQVFRITRAMRASAWIVGEVRDAHGRVPAGASVGASHPETGAYYLHEVDRATGRFRLGPLPPARYTVYVSVDGAIATERQPMLGPDETVDLGVLQVTLAGHAVLRIRRHDGRPLLDPRVAQRREDEGEPWWEDVHDGVTRPDGVVRTRALAPGTHTLRVSARGTGAREISVTIQAGQDTPVEVELLALERR